LSSLDPHYLIYNLKKKEKKKEFNLKRTKQFLLLDSMRIIKNRKIHNNNNNIIKYIKKIDKISFCVENKEKRSIEKVVEKF
jgi:hypothetical protein